MAKIHKPVRFSTHFKVKAHLLDQLNVMDPTLNVDTPLFIDPTLLGRSKHREMSDRALSLYRAHFGQIVRLLRVSRQPGDAAWRQAERLISYHEIKGTCLGYAAGSVRGSGFGEGLARRALQTAREIVSLGVNDPELFNVIPLLEEDIGPDRISDMTTNVILEALIEFNGRVYKEIGVKTKTVHFPRNLQGQFAINPYETGDTPIILVPQDVLRDLPLAMDWAKVGEVVEHNKDLRARVNAEVGEIWRAKTAEDKENFRRAALASQENFEAILAHIRRIAGSPYDFESDPRGLLFWRIIAETIAHEFPFELKTKKALEGADPKTVVQTIIKQFAFLVEERGLAKEFWHEHKPRPEHSAQHMFFAVAYSYCDANNLDITPEAETGYGPVDFKFSRSAKHKLVVEVKLSSNTRLVHGYETQLEIYKAGEKAQGYFLIVDLGIGNLPEKMRQLTAIQDARRKEGEKISPILVVDGRVKASASKR